MQSEAIFLNGVYESVLDEILAVQSFLPEEILFLQPHSASAIAMLQQSPPSVDDPVRLYMSITTDLPAVRFRAEIVGWDDKRNLDSGKRKVIEQLLNTFQPKEGGLYDLSKSETGRSINLLHIRRLERLAQPFSVERLVKTSGGTVSPNRTTAGGWAYVMRSCGHKKVVWSPVSTGWGHRHLTQTTGTPLMADVSWLLRKPCPKCRSECRASRPARPPDKKTNRRPNVDELLYQGADTVRGITGLGAQNLVRGAAGSRPAEARADETKNRTERARVRRGCTPSLVELLGVCAVPKSVKKTSDIQSQLRAGTPLDAGLRPSEDLVLIRGLLRSKPRAWREMLASLAKKHLRDENESSAIAAMVQQMLQRGDSLQEVAIQLFVLALHLEHGKKRPVNTERDDLIVALRLIKRLTFGQIIKQLKSINQSWSLTDAAVKLAYKRRLATLLNKTGYGYIPDDMSPEEVRRIAVEGFPYLVGHLYGVLARFSSDPSR